MEVLKNTYTLKINSILFGSLKNYAYLCIEIKNKNDYERVTKGNHRT